MKLLLDTQALLWFDRDDARLSATARALLESSDNDLLISPASYWEMAIKVSISKLDLASPLREYMDRVIAENQLSILPVQIDHCETVSRLPFHHRDPFDRLLIAQCLVEQIPIVSADEQFDIYSVNRVWK